MVVVVGAVGSSSSCPVHPREGVGAGLEFSLAEERMGGVSSARTGAGSRAWPGTGPEDRMRL